MSLLPKYSNVLRMKGLFCFLSILRNFILLDIKNYINMFFCAYWSTFAGNSVSIMLIWSPMSLSFHIDTQGGFICIYKKRKTARCGRRIGSFGMSYLSFKQPRASKLPVGAARLRCVSLTALIENRGLVYLHRMPHEVHNKVDPDNNLSPQFECLSVNM